MSNPNKNKSLWHVQGLVVLACIVFLILATGTAEARYRAQKNATIQFQIQEFAQIHLGTLSGDETEEGGDNSGTSVEEVVFDPDGILSWTKDGEIHSMNLAVANGTSETDFCPKDQRLRLQLVGSLGLGAETAFPKIELKVPSEDDQETYETFQATASTIKEDSALYHSFGAGWIIRFQNQAGQEPFWVLKGGTLSYQSFTITVENLPGDNETILQPRVEAKVIQ